MASSSRLKLLDAALTATTTSDSQSLSAGSDKFIGWLNVSANNGSTTVAAKIQHSPDKTNWIDLCAFTNVVNTTGVQAVHQGAVAFSASQLFPNIRAVATLTGASATVEISLWFDGGSR